MHARNFTHTHAHTHTHTHAGTRLHARSHTYSCARTHTLTRAHVRTHTRTCRRVPPRYYEHAFVLAAVPFFEGTGALFDGALADGG